MSPRPKGRVHDKLIALRLPKDLLQALEQRAEQEDRSVSYVIRRVLDEVFGTHGSKERGDRSRAKKRRK